MPSIASASVIDIPAQSTVLVLARLAGKAWAQIQYQNSIVWVNRNFIEFGTDESCQRLIDGSLYDSLSLSNRLPNVFTAESLLLEDSFTQIDANRPWLYSDQRRANISNGILEFERVFEIRTLSQSTITQAQIYNTFISFAYDTVFLDNNSFVGVQFRVDSSGSSYYEMKLIGGCEIGPINLVTPNGEIPQTTSNSTAQGCNEREETYVEIAIVDNVLRIFINGGDLPAVNLSTEQALEGGVRFLYRGMDGSESGYKFVIVAGNRIE